MIYILEAHASNLWQDVENLRVGISVLNPSTLAEREGVAKVCVRDLGLEIPALVDNLEDTTEAAYSAWPDRLYVIDSAGMVAYKSEAGPYGFHPSEAERALRNVLGLTM